MMVIRMDGFMIQFYFIQKLINMFGIHHTFHFLKNISKKPIFIVIKMANIDVRH